MHTLLSAVFSTEHTAPARSIKKANNSTSTPRIFLFIRARTVRYGTFKASLTLAIMQIDLFAKKRGGVGGQELRAKEKVAKNKRTIIMCIVRAREHFNLLVSLKDLCFA